ncbi:MAG: peptidylprolyl isomerase [Candidatus Thiodiazotropha sp. (ex Semelilucina semeliformis)]|nr:peptidylprolyl isomerase [Candidatus Thiodiazotropha sp. (ex Semelilucina semeliformis)]
MRVRRDKVVTIEYRMMDSKNELVDSSDYSDPLSFIQGREMVFAAIEKRIEGCQAGDRREFVLEADEAYGPRNEELIRVIPRDRFNYDGMVEVGMTFSAGTPTNRKPVTVIEVNEDEITVDANHPLAGGCLNIDLIVVDVRDAVEKELADGVVQEMADIYARETVTEERYPTSYSVFVKGPM